MRKNNTFGGGMPARVKRGYRGRCLARDKETYLYIGILVYWCIYVSVYWVHQFIGIGVSNYRCLGSLV